MDVWFLLCISLTGILCIEDSQVIVFRKKTTCYMFSTFKLTWRESEIFCRDMNSKLALLKTRKEEFLQRHIIARYNRSLGEYRRHEDSTAFCVFKSRSHGWQWSKHKKCKTATGHFVCKKRVKKYQNASSCQAVDLCSVRQTGYYGPICQYSCPRGCAYNTCDKQSGKCLEGCTEGLKGDFCKSCKDKRRYGSRCMNKCAENCWTCKHRRSCTACRDGFWGTTCNQTCDKKCLNSSCNFTSGTCIKLLSEHLQDETMTTTSLINGSVDEALENISRDTSEISRTSPSVSCQFRSCTKDMDKEAAFRQTEIESRPARSEMHLMISASVQCLLTFVAVIGIFCILCGGGARKTQDSRKNRKSKHTKSKKPVVKRNEIHDVTKSSDDDSFSDHLPDWQNVTVDKLFSQHRDDNSRESFGVIYP